MINMTSERSDEPHLVMFMQFVNKEHSAWPLRRVSARMLVPVYWCSFLLYIIYTDPDFTML